MTAGRALYRLADLQRLCDPQSIAIVGASETRGSFGERTLTNLAGFQGRVYGVNPKYATLCGRPCAPSLAALPEAPDCVVLCVAQPLVAPATREAIAIGAGGVVVYASGYAETGREDRRAAQDELGAMARAGGVRLVGPNCVGFANVRSRAVVNFMAGCGEMVRDHALPHARVAVVSQSGALGYTMLQAMHRGAGVSHYYTAGNSCDVDICDYVAWLADVDDVRAIVCIFEGVASGARFLEAARLAAANDKALIVVKAGNGEAGRKAALSHTGALAGSNAAWDAVFEAVGAIRAHDLEAAMEIASLFAKAPKQPKQGRGVGVMATSGGAGVISADKAEDHGLPLPPLSHATRAVLEQVVPDFGSIANPCDTTAEVLKDTSTFTRCLQAFADDPQFSAVVAPFVFAHAASSGARWPSMCDVAGRTDTLIAAVWMNEWLEGPGARELEADPHVALFRSAGRCFSALRLWHDARARKERLKEEGASARLSPADAPALARALLARVRQRGGVLSEQDSKQLLSFYGVATPREIVAATPDEAARAAGEIGFSVVVKIASADIAHKTEAGGVRLNLRDGDSVRTAAHDILASARRHAPGARIDGVSVQAMAPPGVELVMGVRVDPQFGAMVVVGMGGVLVEVMRDAVTRMAPVSSHEAMRMIESLRGAVLLQAFRGRPALDIAAAAQTVQRLSELAADLATDLAEADVNPVIVGASGAVAADALFVLSSS